jgi:hypothetical protein
MKTTQGHARAACVCGREESRCVGRGGKGPRAGEGRGPAREGESAESRRGPLGPRLFFTPRSLASPDFARDTPLPAKAVTRLAPQTSDRLVRAAGRPRCRGWRAIVGGGAGAVVGVAGEEETERARPATPLRRASVGQTGRAIRPPPFPPSPPPAPPSQSPPRFTPMEHALPCKVSGWRIGVPDRRGWGLERPRGGEASTEGR